MTSRLMIVSRHFRVPSLLCRNFRPGYCPNVVINPARNMSSMKVVLHDDAVSASIEWPGWGLDDLRFWGVLPELKPLRSLQLLELLRECAYDAGFLKYRNLEEYYQIPFKFVDFEVDPTFQRRLPYQCHPYEYPLVADINLSYVGRTSARLDHVIRDATGGQVFMTSSVLLVSVLRSSMEPSPLPDWWRKEFIPTSTVQPIGWKPLQMAARPHFVHTTTVQISSCDYLGHVNNAAYITICLDAIVTGVICGKIKQVTQKQIETMVIKMNQLFIQEGKPGDQLNINVWCQEIDKYKIEVKCTISKVGESEDIYQLTMIVAQ